MSSRDKGYPDHVVLAAYVILTALATYPLVLRFGSAIPAGGDSWVNYWNLWWVKTSLLDHHVNPYFMPDIYFPYGASLYFHTLNLLPAVIVLPITAMFGAAAAFNFLVLLSFVSSGYGMYRLALYVLGREDALQENERVMQLAAFLAGIAFAFSSYRYLHLFGHLDLLSTQWLPLFVLFLLKARDESKVRNVLIAASLLAAAMLTTPYYAMYLILFTGFVAIHTFAVNRKQARSRLMRIAAIVAAFAMMVSPILFPMLFLGRTEGRTPNPTYDVERFSTDALAFVVPSVLTPWARHPMDPVYRLMMRSGTNLEIVTFLGFVPLTLGLIGIKNHAASRRFWLPLAVMFGALALGPVIHVAGRTILPEIFPVMPYRVLSLFPYGDLPRVPARFVVMTMLCLSVIAASGAFAVLRKCSVPIRMMFAAIGIILAIGENAVVPVPVAATEAPKFYRQLQTDPRRYAIVEVPLADDPGMYPERMFYQTVHRKPLYGGYLARGLPPLQLGALPGFGQFKTLSDTIDDVIAYEPAQLRAIGRAVLDFYSAGYVVIEKRLIDSAQLEQARHVADEVLAASASVYEDDAVLAYTVPRSETVAPRTVWLDAGWSYLERLPELGRDRRTLRWRWMSDRARLGLLTNESKSVRLTFTAQAFGRVRRLRLSLGGREVATIPITTDRLDYQTPVFELQPNSRFLELTSLDGADVPGLDARRLSVAMYRIDLIPN